MKSTVLQQIDPTSNVYCIVDYVALSRREMNAWGRFARALGLVFYMGIHDHWVSGQFHRYRMSLNAIISPKGYIVTRLSLTLVNSTGHLALFRETWAKRIEKLLGLQIDIQLGDVEFDPHYIVYSPDPALPARAIQSITRARLLELKQWRFNWYANEARAERVGCEHDPERLEKVLWILLEVAQELEGLEANNG